MSREIFEKFLQRFTAERAEIEGQLTSQSKSISNPENVIAAALKLSSEIAAVWASSNLHRKEKLQTLVFPQGIVFDRQNGGFRPPKVNSVFALIAGLSGVSGDGKMKKTPVQAVCHFLRKERGYFQ